MNGQSDQVVTSPPGRRTVRPSWVITEGGVIVVLLVIAIFLNFDNTELLWLGITMNAIGVGYLLMRIRTARLHSAVRCSATAASQETRVGQ